MRHAHALDLIRNRRAAMKAAGVRLRRRPMPRQLPPKAVALSYFAALRHVLGVARGLVHARVLPRLADWERRAKTWRGDAEGDDVNATLDEVARAFFEQFPNERLRGLAETYGDRTSDAQRAELDKQIRAVVGADVVTSEPNLTPRLEAWAAENVALIKSVPSRYFDEVRSLVLRTVNDGVRPEEIATQIQDRFEVSEARAALIAKDQTSKLFGDLNRDRQQGLGVTRAVWRTANDERVRETHAAMEGVEFSWDEAPDVGGEALFPGEDIQCRCVGDPVLDDLL